MRDVPFFGCNLLLYEQLRAAATARRARLAGSGEPVSLQLSAMELVLIGAAAQGVAGLLTNPVDVLKTRVQSGSVAGVGEALQAALREGGPAALMRGAAMRVVWIAPQGTVYYPTYEWMQRVLAAR